MIFPWEESVKPSLLAVHLILLYFIRISLLYLKNIFLFGEGWRVAVGAVQILCSLKLLIIIWYNTLIRYICIRKRMKSLQYKIIWALNLVK